MGLGRDAFSISILNEILNLYYSIPIQFPWTESNWEAFSILILIETFNLYHNPIYEFEN